LLELRYRWLWLGSIWLLVLLIIVASLLPTAFAATQGGVDKLGHFLSYLLLALVGAGTVGAERIATVMARVIVLGLALEAAQALLTATRSAEWADVAANTAGVLVAWWLCHRGFAGWARQAEAWLERRRQP